MGDRIKRLRTSKGWTQEELGNRVGLKRAAINKYEKGNVENMKRSIVEKMSSIFGVSPSYLMALEQSKPPKDSEMIIIYNKLNEKRQENVLDYAETQLAEQDNIFSLEAKRREKERFSQDREDEYRGALGAGMGIMNFYEDIPDIDNHEWPKIAVPDDAPYDLDWVYTASGDSMEPLFKDGDLVYAKKLNDYERSNLDFDTIYVVRVGGISYLKKIRMAVEGGYLVSLNPKYEDIRVMPDDEVIIVAKVVM